MGNQQGTVIAVGNGKVKDDRKRISLDINAGDRILFGKYAGQEIKLDGEEYLIMKEDEVTAVIEGRKSWPSSKARSKVSTSDRGGTESLLLTTEAVITQIPEPNRDAPTGGMGAGMY